MDHFPGESWCIRLVVVFSFDHLVTSKVEPALMFVHLASCYSPLLLHGPDCGQDGLTTWNVLLLDHLPVGSSHVILHFLYHRLLKFSCIWLPHCLMHVHRVWVAARLVREGNWII